MANILEILLQKHREKTSKLAKQYELGHAIEGLEEAKEFDAKQKSAILEISNTKGFNVILKYEEGIIKGCEELLALDYIPDDSLRKTQIEYAAAKAKYSFLKNLSDPNKK